MLRLLHLLFLLTPVILFSQSNSQDTTTSKPQISASADVYYRYNVNAPEGIFNNFTKFTNSQNTFALGMVSIKAVDTFQKVSAVLNLGFGQRVNEYNYTDASNSLLSAIKEAYISYAATSALKFTAGKWYKHLGYEVVDAYANPNYSMSYTFSYGPMSYTGVRADLAITKRISAMAGIANPADISGTRYTPTKTAIASIGYHSLDNKLSVKLNFQGYGGVARPYLFTQGYYLFKNLQQYDAVIQYAPTKKLDIVYNTTVQIVNDGTSREWDGNVLYVTYKWKPGFSTTLRGERLSDEGALKIGTDVYEATLSSTFNVGNRLHFIAEVRFDDSRDAIFLKRSVVGSGQTYTGLLAAVYAFGK